MSADLKQAITRLIEAAHRGSELLDGCPDDDVSAAASTELSEAAAAVDALLLAGVVVVDLDPKVFNSLSLHEQRWGRIERRRLPPEIEEEHRQALQGLAQPRNPISQADEE